MTDEGKLALDELIRNPHEIVAKLNDKRFPLPKEERCVLMPFPDNMEEETDDFYIGLTVSVSLMGDEALSRLKNWWNLRKRCYHMLLKQIISK